MNSATAALVEQAIIDTEPEPPVFTPVCEGRFDPMADDRIDHWYCDPRYCVEAALDIIEDINREHHTTLLMQSRDGFRTANRRGWPAGWPS